MGNGGKNQGRRLGAHGAGASHPRSTGAGRIPRFARQAGDAEAAGILDIILRDEIGHVAIGNRWYRWLCSQNQLEPMATYAILARQYRAPTLRGPFNLEARRAAGFTEEELDRLAQ